MGKYNVLDIAKYFFDSGLFLSNKKLQKLVFYAYAWYLVKNNDNSNNIQNKLFNSRFEAWVHGPVCPELYYAYNDNRIRDYVAKPIEDCDVKNVLKIVLNVYGKYSGEELENFTHREEPWKKARNGCSVFERCTNTIKDIDIYEYYSKQIV